MKDSGPYTTSKGNKFAFRYDEKTKIAEAIGPLPERVGSAGVVISKKIVQNEDPNKTLIEELEKGGY